MMGKKKGSEDPFELEELRTILAKKRKHKALRATYAKSSPTIRDLNTPRFWDAFNTEGVRGRNPMDDDRVQTVSRFIAGRHILNVGFGSASLEKNYFEKHQKEDFIWSAVDISPASVKKAQKEFPHGKFEVGDILNLKYDTRSFDCVIALEVLEHIPPRNTFTALREVYRVLKKSGRFIVSVPLNEGLEELIARGKNPNAHVRIYAAELIKAELEMSGFTVVKQKYLYAFHKYYRVKSFFAAHILKGKYAPNNVITIAQKMV